MNKLSEQLFGLAPVGLAVDTGVAPCDNRTDPDPVGLRHT